MSTITSTRRADPYDPYGHALGAAFAMIDALAVAASDEATDAARSRSRGALARAWRPSLAAIVAMLLPR